MPNLIAFLVLLGLCGAVHGSYLNIAGSYAKASLPPDLVGLPSCLDSPASLNMRQFGGTVIVETPTEGEIFALILDEYGDFYSLGEGAYSNVLLGTFDTSTKSIVALMRQDTEETRRQGLQRGAFTPPKSHHVRDQTHHFDVCYASYHCNEGSCLDPGSVSARPFPAVTGGYLVEQGPPPTPAARCLGLPDTLAIKSIGKWLITVGMVDDTYTTLFVGTFTSELGEVQFIGEQGDLPDVLMAFDPSLHTFSGFIVPQSYLLAHTEEQDRDEHDYVCFVDFTCTSGPCLGTTGSLPYPRVAGDYDSATVESPCEKLMGSLVLFQFGRMVLLGRRGPEREEEEEEDGHEVLVLILDENGLFHLRLTWLPVGDLEMLNTLMLGGPHGRFVRKPGGGWTLEGLHRDDSDSEEGDPDPWKVCLFKSECVAGECTTSPDPGMQRIYQDISGTYEAVHEALPHPDCAGIAPYGVEIVQFGKVFVAIEEFPDGTRVIPVAGRLTSTHGDFQVWTNSSGMAVYHGRAVMPYLSGFVAPSIIDNEVPQEQRGAYCFFKLQCTSGPCFTGHALPNPYVSANGTYINSNHFAPPFQEHYCDTFARMDFVQFGRMGLGIMRGANMVGYGLPLETDVSGQFTYSWMLDVWPLGRSWYPLMLSMFGPRGVLHDRRPASMVGVMAIPGDESDGDKRMYSMRRKTLRQPIIPRITKEEDAGLTCLFNFSCSQGACNVANTANTQHPTIGGVYQRVTIPDVHNCETPSEIHIIQFKGTFGVVSIEEEGTKLEHGFVSEQGDILLLVGEHLHIGGFNATSQEIGGIAVFMGDDEEEDRRRDDDDGFCFWKFTRTEGGTCTPECAGKNCGTDGCSGTCGTCSTGFTCNAEQQCEITVSVPSGVVETLEIPHEGGSGGTVQLKITAGEGDLEGIHVGTIGDEDPTDRMDPDKEFVGITLQLEREDGGTEFDAMLSIQHDELKDLSPPPELMLFNQEALTWDLAKHTCMPPTSTYHKNSGILDVRVCHLTQFALFKDKDDGESFWERNKEWIIPLVCVVAVLIIGLTVWTVIHYACKTQPRLAQPICVPMSNTATTQVLVEVPYPGSNV